MEKCGTRYYSTHDPWLSSTRTSITHKRFYDSWTSPLLDSAAPWEKGNRSLHGEYTEFAYRSKHYVHHLFVGVSFYYMRITDQHLSTLDGRCLRHITPLRVSRVLPFSYSSLRASISTLIRIYNPKIRTLYIRGPSAHSLWPKSSECALSL